MVMDMLVWFGEQTKWNVHLLIWIWYQNQMAVYVRWVWFARQTKWEVLDARLVWWPNQMASVHLVICSFEQMSKWTNSFGCLSKWANKAFIWSFGFAVKFKWATERSVWFAHQTKWRDAECAFGLVSKPNARRPFGLVSKPNGWRPFDPPIWLFACLSKWANEQIHLVVWANEQMMKSFGRLIKRSNGLHLLHLERDFIWF